MNQGLSTSPTSVALPAYLYFNININKKRLGINDYRFFIFHLYNLLQSLLFLLISHHYIVNALLLLIPHFRNYINSSFLYGGFIGIVLGGIIGLVSLSGLSRLDLEFLINNIYNRLSILPIHSYSAYSNLLFK